MPAKKGPKGNRLKVLTELRNNQRDASLASRSWRELSSDAISNLRHVRATGLLPPTILEQCVDFFFASIYPSQPVLERRHVEEAVENMEFLDEAYAMVLALCAYATIRAGMIIPFNYLERRDAPRVDVQSANALLEESVRIRRDYACRQHPTHQTILASWFCYNCYLEMAQENAAWSYLREATTQAQLLGMHDENTYRLSPQDAPQKRVLYWLLFIAER
ncbi:hypothetical protein N0V95_005231 [Ascochyta clinopodiicola]|nr:hypothetical protein N0V95_005231 [Ascochyta clinopodiicola]